MHLEQALQLSFFCEIEKFNAYKLHKRGAFIIFSFFNLSAAITSYRHVPQISIHSRQQRVVSPIRFL